MFCDRYPTRMQVERGFRSKRGEEITEGSATQA
jgi:hypothetical protein